MRPGRSALVLAWWGSLAVVAGLTLLPTGSGWAWGSPVAELRWYATGLSATTTRLQLLGNLGLLAVPAALGVVLRSGLGHPGRLAGLASCAGAAIELLQWALPLGRVVSPLDAALNAAGAVLAGLLTARLLRGRPAERWTTTAQAG